MPQMPTPDVDGIGPGDHAPTEVIEQAGNDPVGAVDEAGTDVIGGARDELIEATPTDPVGVTAPGWSQRSPSVVVGGGLGIFLLAAIVFAVITVSNDSSRPAGTVRPPASSVTPVTLLPSRAAPPPAPLPTPLQPPSVTAPPTAAAQTPDNTEDQEPPTVTQTVTSQNTVTSYPQPSPPPARVGPPPWLRQLFPHLHLPGQPTS